MGVKNLDDAITIMRTLSHFFGDSSDWVPFLREGISELLTRENGFNVNVTTIGLYDENPDEKKLKLRLELEPLYTDISHIIRSGLTLDFFPDGRVELSEAKLESNSNYLGEIINSKQRLTLLEEVIPSELEITDTEAETPSYIKFNSHHWSPIKITNTKELTKAVSHIAALMPGAYLLIPQEGGKTPLDRIKENLEEDMLKKGWIAKDGMVDFSGIKLDTSNPSLARFKIFFNPYSRALKTSDNHFYTPLPGELYAVAEYSLRSLGKESEGTMFKVTIPSSFRADIHLYLDDFVV